MLKIAVCDDDPAIAGNIAALLSGIGHKYPDKITVDTFLSGEGLIESVKANTMYDIIYLDIELGELNGIDIGRLIRQQSTEALIVFISSYDKYYKPAFDVQPFNFMDKPINRLEFKTLFDRMYARICSNDNLFQYNTNKVYKRVAYKEILYFENFKRQIVMHTLTAQDTFYGSISKLADDLKRKEFILIHQSFLVNYLHITEFDYKEVKLANGQVIMIPVNRRSAVRAEYMAMKRRGIANDAR